MAVLSCGDDPTTPKRFDPPPDEVEFADLTNKDDILFNLELAYNERDIDQFEKLLDDDFAFVFARGLNMRGATVSHWGDYCEIDASRNILDKNLGGDTRVTSIDLDIDYAEDNWTEEPPNTSHPHESWYTQTVGYDLVAKTAGDREYRALGLEAELKIRYDDASGQWRIVQWSDDTGPLAAQSPGGAAVEETTWGEMKALYSDRPYEDLSSKDDVLFNLELAYNDRSYDEFAILLDDDFVFTFSEADFYSGQVDYPYWDRASELASNQKILDPALPGGHRVISIDLDLYFPTFYWVEQPPNPDHPGESWYSKTIDYNLVVKTADDWEYRAIDLKAQFTIRWDESAGQWRAVSWRDDVFGFAAMSPGEVAVKESTWGSIKALYYNY
jgi:hypothetical protein